MNNFKQTIILDFDGVIHAYKGWNGPTHFENEMVEGCAEALEKYLEYFEVAIYSTRSHNPEAKQALEDWCKQRLPEKTFKKLKFVSTKVPSHVMLDDRGITFNGTWPSLETIKNFKPWWKN